MKNIQIGDYVTAFYKTGTYIGEVTGERPGSYVVKVLAVVKHPRQGDLHNPGKVDVPLFHERKALAFREQSNIPDKMVKPYEGTIPEYNESLLTAFKEFKEKLSSDPTPHDVKSIEALAEIQKEYALMYGIEF
ncbi:kinase-associated lipoprotein B [Rossellomorea marisflavi]|uniref:kinase-associated lipoprotein B n=1 Tax=Rossellomorea marisflavi TaxID=189381 RepID=UPI0020410B7F|nr:kinase-associated lipoprotein B [Rossellomorea marisflavi]MCM2591383.1 kinase-associated lipoprotein B [Rossellomorea marisflavi]